MTVLITVCTLLVINFILLFFSVNKTKKQEPK